MRICDSFEVFNDKTSFIIDHIRQNNPHSGARDAFQGISLTNIARCEWDLDAVVQPDDPRIVNLHPASKRDVKRYVKMFEQGSDFPPVVLRIEERGYDHINGRVLGEHFTVMDGAHRLQAAVTLGVPIRAYIGTPVVN